MKRFAIIFSSLLVCAQLFSGENRHVFQNALESVPVQFVRPSGWCPYPSYYDRAGWDAFLKDKKDVLIKGGEEYLDYKWEMILATDYLGFERTGDRLAMQEPSFHNMRAITALTLAELAEGKGRFIDQLINGLFLQTERTSWVWSGHEYRKASGRSLPDYRDIFIDLGAQHVGLQVAVAYYFFKDEFDKVDPAINAAIRHALKEKIFDPYMDPAKWKSQSWLGFEDEPYEWESWHPVNNWNTWTNDMVVKICLFAQEDHELLMKELRQAAISLDLYLTNVDMDGGCNEGAAYWEHVGGELVSYLIAMNDATGGRFGCFDDPQIRAMGLYNSRMYAGDGWSVNFCDCKARYTGEYDLIYLYGKMCGVQEAVDYSLLLNSFSKTPGQIELTPDASYLHREMEGLRFGKSFSEDYAEALANAGGDLEQMRKNLRKNVPEVTWYPGTGHAVFRNRAGWVLGAKGGHNAEGHNHNDVGSFVLYIDGMPVLSDVGNCTYTRQVFNRGERYSIWSMQSQWHNLPVVNGTGQPEGKGYAASWCRVGKTGRTFSLEMSGAYGEGASCNSLVRSLTLGSASLDIMDRFSLSARKAADSEHFITNGDVSIIRDGEIRIDYHSADGRRGGSVRMLYPACLTAEIQTRELDDPVNSNVWGPVMHRIVLRSADNAPLSGRYCIRIVR